MEYQEGAKVRFIKGHRVGQVWTVLEHYWGSDNVLVMPEKGSGRFAVTVTTNMLEEA